MANLSTTIVSDTGYLQLPSGTTAQRPKPSMVLTGLWNNTPGTSANGLALTISAGAGWQSYQNLPNYLAGLATTTSINDTDGSTWTFNEAVRVYMIRDAGWNAVDTTNWTLLENTNTYITGVGTTVVYQRDFAAGSYTFDNNSAMYMFAKLSNYGMLRWNTDKRQVEYYTTGPSQANAAKTTTASWQSMTIPFLTRQIITNHFLLGGYKNSAAWRNVNRTVAATDTTTNLGDILSLSFNYKPGACGDRRAYVFGAGNGHAVTASTTTGFDMVSETGLTIPSRSNMANARYQAGAVFKETTTAWVNGTVTTLEEFDFITDTFRTFATLNNTTNTGVAADMWGMSHENFGVFYQGDAAGGSDQTFTFATKSLSTWSGTRVSNHHQQKSVQSKLQNCYAGNDGSWAGGYTYRRTNMYTMSSAAASINKAYANSGEENYTMGQDWQYMLGMHNGAQNNLTTKFTYATEVEVTMGATTEPKGHDGASSGVCAWRA